MRLKKQEGARVEAGGDTSLRGGDRAQNRIPGRGRPQTADHKNRFITLPVECGPEGHPTLPSPSVSETPFSVKNIHLLVAECPHRNGHFTNAKAIEKLIFIEVLD
ncbi:hypothetical protein AVEN_266199-1 [Araneus ventricosus]|uniref:Uncharacterized protein n=1 Tax=Araneus ventricosus TaxID=182803 RepID=A0A4Y2TQW6_ARAVE|nr:hypothetical protein AVEN_266199-1 [Araneus ventricosus]